MSTLSLTLSSPADTTRLGQLLAKGISRQPFSLLLHGELGCGKTTLTRALVETLPNGGSAEVSSPSFTLCNFYPTVPAVAHCDLYRAGENALLPEEVAEALEEGDCVLVCEWASYLASADRPHDVLEIFFDFLPDSGEKGRALTLGAHGPGASAFLTHLANEWKEPGPRL